MFKKILKWLGITYSNGKVEPADMLLDEQISKSFNDFMNRPIHKMLTSELICNTVDDDLLQTIFDNLSEKLPTGYNEERTAIMAFNKSQQAIYLIWCLEAEVNNGGFNQFYENPGGYFADLLPAALTLVGARQFAELVTEATRVYIAENQRITKHIDGTLEGFSKSYENNPLNVFDDRFYTLSDSEDLRQLQIDYIRKHIGDFVG